MMKSSAIREMGTRLLSTCRSGFAAGGALIVFAACAPDAAPADGTELALPAPAAEASSELTPHGWGPLSIGMTRAEVEEALGPDRNPDAVGGPEPEQCDIFRPVHAPEGMIVMVEQGRLTRITLVRGSEVRTEHGFGVGDPGDEIRAAFDGVADVTPHKYIDSPAEYITIWENDDPGGERRGIVYETGSNGRVTHVHAGGPSIQYVEACL